MAVDTRTWYLACKEVGGAHCDFIAKANTEDEAIHQMSAHLTSKHGIKEITQDLVQKMKSKLKIR